MRKVASFILSAVLAGMLLNAGVALAHSNRDGDRDHASHHRQNHKHHQDGSKLLTPRSLPYALPANAGLVDVIFHVHLINEAENNPQYVYLLAKGGSDDCDSRHDACKNGWNNDRAEVYKLNDQGQNGDQAAGDNIYSATVAVDTKSHGHKGHHDQCLEYFAFTSVGRNKLKSPNYSLCSTSFPVDIAESNTSPQNLIVPAANADPVVANELLVRFSDNANDQQIRSAAGAVGAQVVGSILPRNLYQFRFPQALTVTQLRAHIRSLLRRAGVEHAYPNWVGSVAALPNDPEYILTNQHGYALINADDAWEIGADGTGITISVVDTGIATHGDLSIGGQPDVPNHGTAMAGIAAALTDNAVGIAGVAGNSTLESVIVSPDAAVTMTEMVSALQTVASDPSPPDVVTAGFNVTLAPVLVDTASLDHFDLCRAINDIVLDTGVPVAVVVAAAGNNNSNGNHYPSRCNDSTAAAHGELTDKSLFITVMGSVSCNSGCTPDTRQADSNYGPWIDVVAPATNIRGTNNAGGYSNFSGTSFAAALVAGTAAQMLSCGATPAQIQSRLVATAPVSVPYPGGSKPRIDSLAAILAGNTAPTGIALGGSLSINENTNTSLGHVIGTLSATDANACDGFDYSIQGGADAAAFSIGGPDMDQLIITAGTLDFETKTSYSVTVRVTDAGGLTFDQAFVINVNNLSEAPVVNDQTFSIAENSANGTTVDTVVAADPDAATTLSYSITAGNTGGAFAIGAASGIITVNSSAALDFETTPSFALTVQVSDGVLSDTATVTINLLNLPDTPSFTIYSVRTNYLSALGGATVHTQDFDSFAHGASLVGFVAVPGVTVTSNMTNIVAWDGTSDGDVELAAFDPAGNPTRTAGTGYYDILITATYNAIGFDITAFNPATPGPGVMQVFFLDGTSTSVDIFPTNATEQDPIFFGVISSQPITSIRWNEGPEIGGSGNEETSLDDFAIANLP